MHPFLQFSHLQKCTSHDDNVTVDDDDDDSVGYTQNLFILSLSTYSTE